MGFQGSAFQGNAFQGAEDGAPPPEVDASRVRLLMGVGRIMIVGWLIKLILYLRGIEI